MEKPKEIKSASPEEIVDAFGWALNKTENLDELPPDDPDAIKRCPTELHWTILCWIRKDIRSSMTEYRHMLKMVSDRNSGDLIEDDKRRQFALLDELLGERDNEAVYDA